MNLQLRVLAQGLAAVLIGLIGGCSSSAHSTASRPPEPVSKPPAYLAPLTCWDTVSCCVERNPFTAVESCGVDLTRVASILKTLAEAYATLETSTGTEAGPAAEDTAPTQTGTQAEAAGKRTPKWKKNCIQKYVDCQEKRLLGPCYDCLRRCEGQREWPKQMCPEPRKQN